MNTITQSIGSRIRSYRQKRGLSQEKLAELADLHNTYIGQVERGEKNLTLVSLEKILNALGISFAEFFEAFESEKGTTSYAVQCYDLINAKTKTEQQRLLRILQEIDWLSRK